MLHSSFLHFATFKLFSLLICIFAVLWWVFYLPDNNYHHYLDHNCLIHKINLGRRSTHDHNYLILWCKHLLQLHIFYKIHSKNLPSHFHHLQSKVKDLKRKTQNWKGQFYIALRFWNHLAVKCYGENWLNEILFLNWLAYFALLDMMVSRSQHHDSHN